MPQSPPDRRLNIAVVGAGTIVHFHLRAYAALGERVTAVVDIDEPRAQGVAAQYRIATWLTDWRELLSRDDVDMIDVCTPPKFHAEIVIAALEAGKHVLCEKPLAPNLAEIDDIVRAGNRATTKLCVMHQRRYEPGFRRLKWLADQGRLGRLCFARAVRNDPPPKDLVQGGVWGDWALAGGGVLMTKAIHQLDALCWLLGPPKRVQAMMGTFLVPIESEDHLTASIEFESGALGSLAVSGTEHAPSQQLELIGDQGAASIPWQMRLAGGESNGSIGAELDARFPFPKQDRWRRVADQLARRARLGMRLTTNVNLHGDLLRDFLRTIRNNESVPVSADDARTAVELVTACYASAIRGEAVTLPIAPGDSFYRGVSTNDYRSAVTK